MKNELRLNDQKLSGTKKELTESIVDGLLYCSLPGCTECGGGKLRFKYAKKIWA